MAGPATVVVVALPGDQPLVRVLRDDLREHHPDVPVVVLSEEPWQQDIHQSLQDVEVDGIGYAELTRCWSREDLRAALVPAAVRAAHRESPGATAVLLRPGVRVTGPLLPALLAASRPLSFLAAVPDGIDVDGLEPDDRAIGLCGPVSHAVVVATAGAQALLAHWERSTSPRRWPHDLSRPLFAIASEAVLSKGAGTVPGEALLCDPRWGWPASGALPLAADLSCVDPDHPWVLDPSAARPRVLLSDHPTLAALVSEHLASVGDARVAETTTPLLARLARQQLSVAAGEPLDAWLAAPAGGQPPSPVPRALAAVWEARSDLRALMPRGLHQDARAFARWWLEHGRVDYPLPPSVEAAIRDLEASDVDVAVPDPTRGVTVAGYIGATLGLGRMARLLVDAARQTDLPVSVVENHRTSSRPATDRPTDLPEGFLHTLTLVAVTGDQLPAFVGDLPSGWRADRHTVGVWAWELDALPTSHQAGFVHVDEIWTISEFARAAIARVAPCPVEVVPLPVPVPDELPTTDDVDDLRARLGVKAGPYLLFAFDLLSDMERKNPLGLVDAFRRAFSPGEGPLLVLKVLNMDLRVVDAERLRLAVRDREDILLVEEALSSDDVRTLMAGAIAYVSLHRSEGFGLTLAEAMSLGVPCIATGYGGNLDFMDDEVSLLVPYELVDPPARSAYSGARWAEPDQTAAVEAMRRVMDDPAFAQQLGGLGRKRIAEVCSLERTAQFLAARVPEPPPPPAPPPPPPAIGLVGRLRARSGGRRR